MARLITRLCVLTICLGAAGASLGGLSNRATAQTVRSIVNISPSHAGVADPDAATGGRVNHLAVDPTNNRTLYAASEWGGLWKSEDGGLPWNHLDGHQPQATRDVAVDPSNPKRVYATSLFDGKVSSLSGEFSVGYQRFAGWRIDLEPPRKRHAAAGFLRYPRIP